MRTSAQRSRFGEPHSPNAFALSSALLLSSCTMTYTRRETREATEEVRTLLSSLKRDRRRPIVVLEQQAELRPPGPGMKCRMMWDADAEGAPRRT